jgi:hypothetical protein
VLLAGATRNTPAAALVPLDDDFAVRLEAAVRLWQRLSGLGGTESKRLTPQRRERLTFTLRALDARLAIEHYRAIAQGLFGEARVPSAAHWKTHDLRARTIRLVRSGLDLMRGGYIRLRPHRRQRPPDILRTASVRPIIRCNCSGKPGDPGAPPPVGLNLRSMRRRWKARPGSILVPGHS